MKVLASDFDGTLFFHDKGFKEEDIEKIKEFQQKGHLFGICSGRSLKGIQVQIDPRIQLDFYIISSGAQILDKDLNMISQHIIDKNVVIPPYTRIGFDREEDLRHGFHISEGGVTVVPKGSIL